MRGNKELIPVATLHEFAPHSSYNADNDFPQCSDKTPLYVLEMVRTCRWSYDERTICATKGDSLQIGRDGGDVMVNFRVARVWTVITQRD